MSINYKTAYQSLQADYKELLQRNLELADYRLLIRWIQNDDRKPAINAFTEGNERQVAYSIEWLVNTLEKPDLSGETEYIRPPMLLKVTEKCPHCGFIRYES